MTSTSESLLLCARYIWMFICISRMRVCYTHEKCVRRAPYVGWQIGEGKRRTCTGDKRNIVRWTRLDENYFVIENIIYTDTREYTLRQCIYRIKLHVYVYSNSNNVR